MMKIGPFFLSAIWSILALMFVYFSFVPSVVLAQYQDFSEDDLQIYQFSIASETFEEKVKTGEYAKIGPELGVLMDASRSMSSLSSAKFEEKEYLHYTNQGQVLVHVIFSLDVLENIDSVLEAFKSSGDFQETSCIKNVCTGFAKIDSLVTLAAASTVAFIKPFVKPTSNTGSVTSEGDISMQSDKARESFNVDGTGLKVGVLSDSFDCFGGYQTDVQTGDLPADVQVVRDFIGTGCTDEGRAMAQIVHDVAPGAKLAFRDVIQGPQDFAQGIFQMAEIGCNVIADDIRYFAQPWFQDDVITQAVDTVASQGIPYFSAAGNSAREAWHTDIGFVQSGYYIANAPLHNFSPTKVDVVQDIFLTGGQAYRIEFQWDQPFASTPGSVGSTSDLDLYLCDDENNIIASSTTANIGGDAVESISFTAAYTGRHGLSIAWYDGPMPNYMKWQIQRGGPFEGVQYSVLSSTSYGNANAAGGAGVGAVLWSNTPSFGVDPPIQQAGSSAGGTPIFFDTFGNRTVSPIIRKQPRIMGPDGVITTFFGNNETRFFGTSAAAPHVAAVAALMLQLSQSLTPSQIYFFLEVTALDMNDAATPEEDPGYDTGTGYGFIDALAALNAITSTPPVPAPTPNTIPAPTPVVAPTPTLPAPAPAPSPIAPTPMQAPSPTSPPLQIDGTLSDGAASTAFNLTQYDDSNPDATVQLFQFTMGNVAAGTTVTCNSACVTSATATKRLSFKEGTVPFSFYDTSAFSTGDCPLEDSYTMTASQNLFVFVAGLDEAGIAGTLTCSLSGPPVPSPAPSPKPSAAPAPASKPSAAPAPAPKPSAAPTPVSSQLPTPGPKPTTMPQPTPVSPPAPSKMPAPIPIPAPSPIPTDFSIALTFKNDTEREDIVLTRSVANLWQRIFTADLPDYNFPNPVENPCGGFYPQIDDVVMCVRFDHLDDGVLAIAGPDLLRSEDFGGLPAAGSMMVDKDQVWHAQASLKGILTHSMGHIFGIGTIWQPRGLVSVSPSNVCSYKVESRASAEYQSLSGCETAIPIESVFDDKKERLICSHWDERCFGGELMTPVEGDGNVFSRITIAGMEDLGYGVTYRFAEDYSADDLDESCRCASGNVATVMKDRDASAYPGLSQEGLDKVLALGDAYMAQNKELHSASKVDLPGVAYVGDKVIAILYREKNQLFSIIVTADDEPSGQEASATLSVDGLLDDGEKGPEINLGPFDAENQDDTVAVYQVTDGTIDEGTRVKCSLKCDSSDSDAEILSVKEAYAPLNYFDDDGYKSGNCPLEISHAMKTTTNMYVFVNSVSKTGLVQGKVECEIDPKQQGSKPDPESRMCFSEDVTVQVLGKGKVQMKDIHVGDYILGGNEYEEIYGFVHYDALTVSKILEIHSATTRTVSQNELPPLRISMEHLLLVNGAFIPAKRVQIGDVLHTEDGSATVTSVNSVLAKGLYAPLTASGSFMANGVRVSSYVSLQEDLPENLELKAGNMMIVELTQHQFIHMLLSPIRMICMGEIFPSLCSEEFIDQESGYPGYVKLGLKIVTFFDRQNSIVQLVLYLAYLVLFGSIYLIELCVGAARAPMIILTAIFIVSRHIWNKKCKKHQLPIFRITDHKLSGQKMKVS